MENSKGAQFQSQMAAAMTCSRIFKGNKRMVALTWIIFLLLGAATIGCASGRNNPRSNKLINHEKIRLGRRSLLNPSPKPTESPLSPIVDIRFPAICRFSNGNIFWSIYSYSYLGSELRFYFSNPNGSGLFPGNPGIYPDCNVTVCHSHTLELIQGENLEFEAPDELTFTFKCGEEETECSEMLIAPDTLAEC